MPKQNIGVWFEIPVSDLAAAKVFYQQATGLSLNDQEMGPNTVAVFAYDGEGVSGHLYEGKPAAGGNGPTIHIAVSGTVEEAIERTKQAGGKVVTPVIEIPAGRFAYAVGSRWQFHRSRLGLDVE